MNDTNKKIFVVDDDDSISNVIRIFLEDEGYIIKTFSNCSIFEKNMRTEKPDLLIIDYLLPERNGIDVVKTVRKESELNDLPIIMIAANQIHREKALKSGVNEFLSKPFDLYEVLNLVKRYMKKS